MSVQESESIPVTPAAPPGTGQVFLAPPSYAQERLWFLEHLDDGGATAYNVGFGLRLTGKLDVAALGRALAGLVQRHEVLRTTLALHDGELTQFIGEPRPDGPAVEDLSGLADPQAAMRERAARELRTPFDVATGPVYRATLLRTGAEEHVLLLVFDHMVCDAWSLRVAHRDLVAGYRAEVLGTRRPDDPAIQYADFAQWQREWLDSGELDRQLGYWRERLAEPPARTRFAVAPKSSDTPATASCEQPLPDSLIAALRERGHREGASVFMTAVAAFAAVLAHHTGQQDLTIGTLLANRHRAEVEDLIGFFANTAVLRLDLSRGPTVSALIGRARECTLGAYDHQDIPFHRLVEELQPRREPGELPYFDAMVQLADVERDSAEVAGVRIDPVPLDSQPAPVGLVLTVLKQGGGHTAVWDYQSDWIDAAGVAVLQEHFLKLLTAFADGADGAVSELSADVPALAARAAAPPEAAPAPVSATRTGSRPAAAADSGPWFALATRAWEEVLGYDAGEIGPDDDFFDLGGHSLAAGRVVSRLNRHCAAPVPIRVLFDHPVLAEFAAALKERSGAAGG